VSAPRRAHTTVVCAWKGAGGWTLSFSGNEELRTIPAIPVPGRNVSPDVFHVSSAIPQRRRSVQLSNPLSGC